MKADSGTVIQSLRIITVNNDAALPWRVDFVSNCITRDLKCFHFFFVEGSVSKRKMQISWKLCHMLLSFPRTRYRQLRKAQSATSPLTRGWVKSFREVRATSDVSILSYGDLQTGVTEVVAWPRLSLANTGNWSRAGSTHLKTVRITHTIRKHCL